MAIDYAAIRDENERKYGTDIGRFGGPLMADRYDDKTHFIFEILQNAEDALGRRRDWRGPRAVRFDLSTDKLRVGHFGKPFDMQDVQGICGIAESSKDHTSIGRFGIGFKSVYVYSDRPEIHSGSEDFAIESYVWPIAIAPVDRKKDETVFVLPLTKDTEADGDEIAEGLRRLGPRTLLFLREIDEIAWSVDGGPSGIYVRGAPEEIGDGIFRVQLLGEEGGQTDIEESWLLFSQETQHEDGTIAGRVEIAFFLEHSRKTGNWSVQPLASSPLVVFFPTVVETHLGFLVQGPYRTTPSRDNVPKNDPWNRKLVHDTAALLAKSLHSLRAHGLLDVDALQAMPLDSTKFREGNMFSPLFASVRNEFRTEQLLPAFGNGHVSAASAKLARTQELRELFSSQQLAKILGVEEELTWLSSDITQDRTPELRKYLMSELDIAEVTPEVVLPRLTGALLEEQSDDWIRRLYEFLLGQRGQLRQPRFESIPLIRIDDGRHVPAFVQGRPQAFLPGPVSTGFPTVPASVLATQAAHSFVLGLGLTVPDPVDDVVQNVLPKYAIANTDVTDAEYEADLEQILAAFATDSKGQRDKLVQALRTSYFVKVVDAGSGWKWTAIPGNTYIATERLKDLFAGVPGVNLVDDSYSCLRGESIRELLEATGSTRYLQPVFSPPRLDQHALKEMRREAGAENNTLGWDDVKDFTLRGLDRLFATWSTLSSELAAAKAVLLWEALCDVQDRRGSAAFLGRYRWFYYHERYCEFDAAVIGLLNATEWVPGLDGLAKRPDHVVFDGLGWKENAFLLSKIHFKPAIIEQLAREAGFDPGVLDLLKKLGLTSESELRDRLGMLVEQPTEVRTLAITANGETETMPAADPDRTAHSDRSVDAQTDGINSPKNGHAGAVTEAGHDNHAAGLNHGKTEHSKVQLESGTPTSTGARPFISYIAVQANDEEPDPDGLDQRARMHLEDQAVGLILEREPGWQRTPANNPGYDLFKLGDAGEPSQWCEVKAMTGTLHDHPVGLSHTQFDHAQRKRELFWLYVVEQASGPTPRIVRIQDPAGRASSFTFDHGWESIASIVDLET